jgi:hypothetical protein
MQMNRLERCSCASSRRRDHIHHQPNTGRHSAKYLSDHPASSEVPGNLFMPFAQIADLSRPNQEKAVKDLVISNASGILEPDDIILSMPLFS